MSKPQELSQALKLLIALYEASEGRREKVFIEDIAVKAYKLFPGTFHLRGYPQYPDSSDRIHRPLYDFPDLGYADISTQKKGKAFTITEKGISKALELLGRKENGIMRYKQEIEKEIQRILSTRAYQLFRGGEKEKILDTDFWRYLNVTVRSDYKHVRSILSILDTVIKKIEGERRNDDELLIVKMHNFLLEKFKMQIDEMKGKESIEGEKNG